MNVLIIAERALTVSGLELIIRKLDPEAEILHLPAWGEGSSALAGLTVHLIMLDNDSVRTEGLGIIKSIRKVFADIPLIVLSDSGETVYVLLYINAGVNGFISKNASVEHFQTAIRKTLDGQKYVDKHVQDSILQSIIANKPIVVNPVLDLTSRERLVLTLIMEKKSMHDIALLLDLKEDSVKRHRYHIFKKMNVKSESELVEKALVYQ